MDELAFASYLCGSPIPMVQGKSISLRVPANAEFVIEGVVSSLTLTPQDKPEYVVTLPSGKRYRIRSQPLSETFFDDGTAVSPSTLRQGMTVRATVAYFPDEGVAGEYRTADLIFFLAEE